MSSVINEITPLSEKDCLHIVERHKKEFSYPLHRHKEYELNFVEHATGVKRIVGDSVEVIGEYDLVLIAAENLEHVWEQGDCHSDDIREITMQFSPSLIGQDLLSKNQFSSISKMLTLAERGLCFPISGIMRVYPFLDKLASEPVSFVQLLRFMSVLYTLSCCDGARVLASSTFAHAEQSVDSRRVQKVKQYVSEHFHEQITLDLLADMVGMTPSGFSRFFKLRTGKSLSDYVIDTRLGVAARLLVDTAKNISEICYECGFNNVSNFNRIFKAKRGITPKEFRNLYKKNVVTI